MNRTKFYRYMADGNVQMAMVNVPQPSLATRRQHPSVYTLRHIEDAMLRAGWTRKKLKATQRKPVAQAVFSALQNMAYSKMTTSIKVNE